MQRRRAYKAILSIFVAAAFFVLPLRFDLEKGDAEAIEEWVISQDTFWGNDDNILVDKKIRIRNGATLTVEKGATIRFTNHGDTCNTPIMNVENGRIVSEGTKDEPITFISNEGEYAFSLAFKSKPYNAPSIFRYAKFERGGHLACPMLRNDVFNSAYAGDFDMPAIFYSSGKVHIENSDFVGSYRHDIGVFTNVTESNLGDYIEVVNSNFSGSGNDAALISSISCLLEDTSGCKGILSKVLLKNNWYGKFNGPTEEGDDSQDKGGKIIGTYKLEGYRNNNLISDPVIIIPGIMGSASVAGKLVLDPILQIYENLINSLDQNGYMENINLFKFPYQWRDSNEISAEKLKTKIQDVVESTKVSRVDLVAHSMGGLVARQYIENSEYQNNVDQLITLGTPHKGAPESYMIWEAGEKGINLEDVIIEKIFKVEAKHKGYNSLKEYIQEEVVSAGELLPDYDYLEENGEIKNYPDGYPRNEFLEGLNDSENLENLDKVNFINIIGEDKDTISGFRVVDSTEEGKWAHGMPENFYDPSTDQGIKYGNGDETVPLKSSTGIDSDKTIELETGHSKLPSKSQCKILAELSNRSEADCDYINDFSEVISLLTFGVFSPVDIQVVSPSGKRVGKNFEDDSMINEIEGAYYTGFDTEDEFLTVPNPEDGEYRILTQGTGEGNYRIEVAKISEVEGSGNATESTVEFEGIAMPDGREELKVEVDGNEVVDKSKDLVPPVIEISSPEDGKDYVNTGKLQIAYSVSDNISAQENIDVEVFFDGAAAETSEINLAMQKLGSHFVKITASDEAGNLAEKEANFTVSTNPSAFIENIKFYHGSGLIKNRGQKQMLITGMHIIQKKISMLDEIENNSHISEKAKAIIKGMIQSQIKKHAYFLIRHVQAHKKFFDPSIRELIVEDLAFIAKSI